MTFRSIVKVQGWNLYPTSFPAKNPEHSFVLKGVPPNRSDRKGEKRHILVESVLSLCMLLGFPCRTCSNRAASQVTFWQLWIEGEEQKPDLLIFFKAVLQILLSCSGFYLGGATPFPSLNKELTCNWMLGL